MRAAVCSIRHLWKLRKSFSDEVANTVIAQNLNTAGTCKRVQIFVLVALILYPQSVRQVVQEYRNERSERRRWKMIAL
jgi:hypothetical protein